MRHATVARGVQGYHRVSETGLVRRAQWPLRLRSVARARSLDGAVPHRGFIRVARSTTDTRMRRPHPPRHGVASSRPVCARPTAGVTSSGPQGRWPCECRRGGAPVPSDTLRAGENAPKIGRAAPRRACAQGIGLSPMISCPDIWQPDVQHPAARATRGGGRKTRADKSRNKRLRQNGGTTRTEIRYTREQKQKQKQKQNWKQKRNLDRARCPPAFRGTHALRPRGRDALGTGAPPPDRSRRVALTHSQGRGTRARGAVAAHRLPPCARPPPWPWPSSSPAGVITREHIKFGFASEDQQSAGGLTYGEERDGDVHPVLLEERLFGDGRDGRALGGDGGRGVQARAAGAEKRQSVAQAGERGRTRSSGT
ncbi:hypothetical protein AcW2_006279 [Taiwanofungus camphoratus]|nr:hypothetical protein AcW2_006279 [Antrodia cinnamomea]